jgi:wyosine [tRNA(Phe)-imidazoG37] synthetase (radical SAM superfamily)
VIIISFLYGIVPSRRLGRSLGVSPIPFKICNYSCVYCQLGRTHNMTNERKTFFPPEDIIDEFKNFVKIYDESNFDVVTIVSEGEPVLYFPINVIIDGIKK